MPRKHNKSDNAAFAPSAPVVVEPINRWCPTAAAESLAADLACQLGFDGSTPATSPTAATTTKTTIGHAATADDIASQVAQLLAADTDAPSASSNVNNDLAFLFTPVEATNDGSDSGFANDSAAALAAPTLAERVAAARRRLLNPTPKECEAIATDLAARMSAGRGECIYELGMLDDDASVPLNLTSADFDAALATIASIVASPPLNAAVTYIGEKSPTHSTAQTVEALLTTPSTATSASTAPAATLLTPTPAPTIDPRNRCGYLLIRRIPSNVQDVMEVRVAVCGNVDAGKSSCLGVLTKNALDNGRGKARSALFRHKHELETGRTSSLGMECVGFDARGAQVGVGYNPATDASRGGAATAAAVHEEGEEAEDEADATPAAPTPIRKAGWDEIAQAASKVLTFIDLAGHEKYLKTTVYGLCGTAPDFAMLMVGANMGIIGMTKEHLGLNLALNVPVMIVVTKIDMCPGNVLEATLKQLLKVLKSPGCRKIPMFVRSHEDVVRVSNTFVSDRICPIFLVSNVTGQGLPYLRQFLNLLPMMTKYAPDAPVEYQITESFSVPGVGTVVSGTILSGVVCVGDQLMLGPDTLGNFTLTQVKGIHIKRVPVPVASAGHTASFALKKIKRSQLRKGMVLVSPNPAPFASREFEAECLILFHSTTINTKYQAMLHCGNVRQTASLVDMDRGVLRSGDRARVRFRFLQYPEYIKPGSRVLFREGRTKGIGKVTRVYAPGEVIEPFNSDEMETRASPPVVEPKVLEDLEPPTLTAKSTAPLHGERVPRFKGKSAATVKVPPASAAAAGPSGAGIAGANGSKPRGHKA